MDACFLIKSKRWNKWHRLQYVFIGEKSTYIKTIEIEWNMEKKWQKEFHFETVKEQRNCEIVPFSM